MGLWSATKGFHGSYCGEGNQGGPPVDDCDACCAIHDACYETHGYGMLTDPAKRAPCDVPFVECLQAASECPWLKRQVMIRAFAGGHQVDRDFPQWRDPRVSALQAKWRESPEDPSGVPPYTPCPDSEFDPTDEEHAMMVLEGPYCAPLVHQHHEKECHCV